MLNRPYGALVLMACLFGSGAAVRAQAPMAQAPAIPGGVEERSLPAPGVKDELDRKPGDGSLSGELARTNGVVAPPPTGDDEIHKSAPVPEPNSTPVIPPPGTPGGDPTVRPK